MNVGTRINAAMDLSDLNWKNRRYGMMKGYAESKPGNIHLTGSQANDPDINAEVWWRSAELVGLSG